MTMDIEIVQYKVLLLIDLDSMLSQILDNKISADKCSNYIRVAALKILYKIFSETSSENKQFQWTFKCYSQNKKAFEQAKQKFKHKSSFQELTLAAFESFETNLDNLLNFLLECNHQDWQEEKDRDYVSDCLTTELNDVITGYPWAVPEILSPVKPTVRRRSGKDNKLNNQKQNRQHGNRLFLFSICPKSNEDLSAFNGHSKVDVKNLLGSFMSTELQKSFTNTCLFYWVDIHLPVNAAVQINHSSKYDRFCLMDQAIQCVGGRVIHVEDIVSSGQLSSVYIGNCVLQSSSNAICDNETSIAKPFAYPSTLSGAIPHHKRDFSSKLYIGGCETNQNHSFIAVGIIPMLQNKDTLLKNLQRSCDPETEYKSSPVCVYSGNHLLSKYPVHFQDKTNTDMPLTHISVRVVGSLQRCNMPEFCYSSDEVYMLTPNPDEKPAFENYMLQSARSNTVQICEVYVDIRRCITGVLQPLTSVCGTLTLLPSIVNYLPLHKLLLSSNNESSDADIQSFIDNSVMHINKVKFGSTTVINESTRPVNAEVFNAGFLENYYIPGSSTQSTMSICKQLGNLSEDAELQILTKLQNKYRERKSKRLTDVEPCRRSPRKSVNNTPSKLSRTSSAGINSNPTSPSSGLRRSPRKKPSSFNKNTEFSKQVLPPKNVVKRNRGHTAPGRVDMVWDKCIEKAIEKQQKASTKETTIRRKDEQVKPEKRNPEISIADDIKCEEDMISYLKNVYDETADNSSGLLSTVQRLINMTVLFKQTKNAENPQESACELITSCIVHDAKYIKQKHKEFTDYTFREYELQVLLHLELETLQRDKRSDDDLEDIATKIGLLLVPMGIARHGFVSKYLDTVLLENYVDSLPVLLTKIYDELMLQPPDQLQGMFSPEGGLTSVASVYNPPSSFASFGSSETSSAHAPNSEKGRRKSDKVLNRYSSLHSVTSRQIQLPKQQSTKSQGKPSSTRRSTRIASTKKTKTKADKDDGDTKKVKKNLFGDAVDGVIGVGGDHKRTKLERRQSVAVMENLSNRHTNKTPKKSKHRQEMRTPRSKRKDKRVTETPAHKQKSNMTWRQQEKARRKTLPAATVIQIVPESPSVKGTMAAARKTPRKTPLKTPNKTPRGALMKRKSFYGSKTDDKGTKELYDKIGKLESRLTNKILSPTWSKSENKLLAKFGMSSPRRIQPRMLFCNLHSPSPKKMPITRPLNKSPSDDDKSPSENVLGFDSPAKGTRSHTSEFRNICHDNTGIAGNITPKKTVSMKLFQSPVPSRVRGEMFMSPVPNRVRGEMFMSPRSILSPSKGLKNTPRKSVSYVLPNSPFIHIPGNDKVMTPRRDELAHVKMAMFGRSSPKTQVCLNFTQSKNPAGNDSSNVNSVLASPLRRSEIGAMSPRPLTRSQIKNTPQQSASSLSLGMSSAKINLSNQFGSPSKSLRRHKSEGISGKSPVKMFKSNSGGLETMFSANSLNTLSPGKSKRLAHRLMGGEGIISNIESRGQGFGDESKIEANFLMMSPRRSGRFSQISSENFSQNNSCSSSLFSSTQEDPSKENASGSHVSKRPRRRLSGSQGFNTVKVTPEKLAGERSNSSVTTPCKNGADESSQGFTPSKKRAAQSNTPSKKRKSTPEKFDLFPEKKRRHTLQGHNSMPSFQNSQEYFESEEIFIETHGRTSERPLTKSSLFSDQSDNSHGFGDFDQSNSSGKFMCRRISQLTDVTNCDSNMSEQGLLSKYMPKDSFESVDSPVFNSISQRGGDKLVRGISNLSNSTVDSEVSATFPGIKTMSDLTSSESASQSPVFTSVTKSDANTTAVAISNRLSITKNTSISPSKQCDRITPVMISPSRQHQTGRVTPNLSSITPGKTGTKYSPLTSSKSLALLIESPLVSEDGEKRKCKSRTGVGSGEQGCVENSGNSGDGKSGNRTRRSLYRTKTNLGVS